MGEYADDDFVFVCTECMSDQRIDPYKNAWVQSGLTPPCKVCGGVVIYVEGRENRDDAIHQHNVTNNRFI